MAVSQESSLLFSLKELERIEEGRVAEERERAAARREAARRAALERARAAEEVELQRILEQERRQREEEARRRDEERRLAAIERAAVERARAEVEARSHAELSRARDAHELALVAARSAALRRNHRLVIAASFLVTLTAGGIAAAVSAELRQRERLDAATARVSDEEKAEHERTLRALDQARARVDELENAIHGLRVAQPSALPEPAHGAPSRGSSARKPQKSGNSPSLRACGLDGDPLNGCLPSR